MSGTLLLALALGCSTSRLDDRPAPEAAVFPHEEHYEAGNRHGHDAVGRGVATCALCHGVDRSTAPTCDSCHAAYPHPDGWRAGAVHGADLVGNAVADGARAVCDACHANEGLEATTDHGCDTCHGSYPHADGWAERGVHGSYALARPDVAAVCGSCHGAGLDGGDVGVGCTDCHASWPHGLGWTTAAHHGAEALADLDGCAACHATDGDWDGGTAQVACSRCHAAYPHDDAWAVDHIVTANRIGEAICLRCHEEGDGPDTVPATCGSTCHGSAR